MIKPWRLVWLALSVAAGPAHAHSPVPGIEGFYVGLLHPFSTPPQALLMLGLGLLVGGFHADRARWVLPGFLVATLAGLFAGIGFETIVEMMFAVSFAACACAALFPGRLVPLALALAAVGGFLIGDASVPDAGPTRDRIITMSGSIIGANIGLLYLFGVFLFLRERYPWPWVGIAFRVAAAWVGAIALVMLALRFAPVAPPA